MASLKEEVSLDLDMLGIAAGGILYRAADRWRVLAPSQPGMYLVIQNDGFPAWEFNVPTPYTDTDWQPLPLLNGAAPFSATGPQPQYRRNALGMVQISGFLNAVSASSTVPRFEMPEGTRPPDRVAAIIQTAGQYGRIRIDADGLGYFPAGGAAWCVLHVVYMLGGTPVT